MLDKLTHHKTLCHKGQAGTLLEQVLGTFSLAEQCIQKSTLVLHSVSRARTWEREFKDNTLRRSGKADQ